MSYTPPAGDNAGFSWVGEAADYTAPAGDAAGFSWTPDLAQGRAAAASPLGPAAAVGAYTLILVTARVAAPSPLGPGAAQGQPVVAATARGLSPLQPAAARGELVTAGRTATPSPLGAGAALARVLRYELRGEVRKDGVLVDRTVRAHRLSDGAVLAEDATTGGAFRLPVGFAAVECYTLALDLTAGATDYTPPIANHVVAELADDTA